MPRLRRGDIGYPELAVPASISSSPLHPWALELNLPDYDEIDAFFTSQSGLQLAFQPTNIFIFIVHPYNRASSSFLKWILTEDSSNPQTVSKNVKNGHG